MILIKGIIASKEILLQQTASKLLKLTNFGSIIKLLRVAFRVFIHSPQGYP